MIKFSLLIAAYNAERFLRECLDSLTAQSEQEWEALCVDDASTDATLSILQAYAQRDPRFRIRHLDANIGQAAARNIALQQAQGEFVLMLDADDVLDAGALQTLWLSHQQHPEADAHMMTLVKFYSDEVPTRFEEYPWPQGVPYKITGREASLLSLDWKLHGLYALRRGLHQQFPFDDARRRYTDDNTCRLHFWHCAYVVRTAARYFYRQHAASCTHASGLARMDFLEANRRLRTQFEALQAGAKALRRIETHCWQNFVGIYREFLATSPQHVAELREYFCAMRPTRLPWRVALRPSTLYVPSFRAFCLWQRLLLRLRPQRP